MENRKYKYNAFISYRHNDLDKFVAENLHRLIETYVMPKSVVEKYNITDNNYRKVFRDQDELPLASNLENPIIEALKESEFLIVICSPRLKESIWCQKEIENFIKFHGRNNILCVLVEGEPKDSFPSILQSYTVKKKDKSGKEISKKVYYEPLAMDVRGKSKKEIYKNLKNELIRVIAPMYKLDYDDIKQRHEERKIKKKVRLFKIATVICLLFAIYSASLFLKIYISAKKLKYNQSITLATKASEILLNDDRNSAIEKAYQSVTKYEKIKLPITSKGIYELTDSLGVYYLNEHIYPISQLDTLGIVEHMQADTTNKYLLSYDSSGELVLWELKKESRIITITNLNATENSYTFIGKDKFAYINKQKEVVILDLKGKEITKIKLDILPKNIIASRNGKYLEIDDDSKIYLYETSKYTEISFFEVQKDLNILGKRYFDEKEENLLFAVADKNELYSDNLTIETYNIKQQKIINKTNIDADRFRKVIFNNNDAIVLMQKKNKLGSNIIVIKYNYEKGLIDYQKEYNKEPALDIAINLKNKDNKTLLIISENVAHLLDYETGKESKQYSLSDHEINTYALRDGNYAMFSRNGYLYSIATDINDFNDVDNVISYLNIFNCNLTYYQNILLTSAGYLAYTLNDNRIIIYNNFNNKVIKQIKYTEKTFDKLSSKKVKELAEKYNNKKKNLVSSAFYSKDKQIIFIVYTDNKLEVYNVKTKKLLNEIIVPKNAKYLDTYLAKTKDGKHIIKGRDGYILDKNYNLIAYVPKLYDYRNGKLILTDLEQNYYEVKLYSAKEIIAKGKAYLQKAGKLS